MGNRLIKYYDEAKQLGGLKATMRLAVLTGMPSNKAETAEDLLETIDKFEKAMQELKKEF